MFLEYDWSISIEEFFNLRFILENKSFCFSNSSFKLLYDMLGDKELEKVLIISGVYDFVVLPNISLKSII